LRKLKKNIFVFPKIFVKIYLSRNKQARQFEKICHFWKNLDSAQNICKQQYGTGTTELITVLRKFSRKLKCLDEWRENFGKN
jgi:hypothetical protein